MFDPQGLRPFVVKWEQAAVSLLQRVKNPPALTILISSHRLHALVPNLSNTYQFSGRARADRGCVQNARQAHEEVGSLALHVSAFKVILLVAFAPDAERGLSRHRPNSFRKGMGPAAQGAVAY